MMNKGQRATSSTDSEEKQRSDDEDSKDSLQHGSSSSAEEISSGSDVLSASRMKRSQGFSCSFSFEEDQQAPSQSGVQTQPQRFSRDPVPELVQSEPAAQCSHPEGQDTCNRQPPRSGLFRPQDLWLAVTRCLSIRWPPCLSLNRLDKSNRKLIYQKNCSQSQKSFSSDSLDLANKSSSTISTSSEDINVTLEKKEEDGSKSREVKRGPRWGVSRSSPRLPRDRQMSNLLLASMILERDMFLTVELIDRGEEEQDLRYQAEWKLTEKSRELAAGQWLSRTQID
ncbi:hypothetical protein WMY93_019902 [Mugilogobius chulae]|uniref:Uncharacterized protein n=1 Tax=Mugilogobius chulae TaxID=88201 RepID=A0AAW0NLE9_9GOBI